jgi:outer membrane protein TolC
MNNKLFMLLITISLIAFFFLTNTVLAAEIVNIDPSYAVKKILEGNLKIRAAELELSNARLDYQENLSISNNYKSVKIKTLIAKIQAEKNYKNIRFEQIYSTINNYFQLYKKIEQQKIIKKKVKFEERKLQQLKAEVNVGYKKASDEFEQENEYHNQKIELDNLKGDIALEIAEIKTELGIEDDFKINLKKVIIPDRWNLDKNEITEKAIHNSMDLDILEEKINLASLELKKARVGNQAPLQMERLDNHLKLTRINYKSVKQELIQSIKRKFLILDQAVKQIEIAQNRIEQLTKNQSILEDEFNSGRITRNDLLTADINLLEAKHRLLESVIDYYLTEVELKQIVGLQVGVSIDEFTEK